MPRSVEFYGRVYGLSVVNEEKANEIVRLGIGKTILLSLRHDKQNPPGVVDHFAFGVDGFNKEAITRELKAQGLTPHENLQYGFYVNDPDGVVVHLISLTDAGQRDRRGRRASRASGPRSRRRPWRRQGTTAGARRRMLE